MSTTMPLNVSHIPNIAWPATAGRLQRFVFDAISTSVILIVGPYMLACYVCGASLTMIGSMTQSGTWLGNLRMVLSRTLPGVWSVVHRRLLMFVAFVRTITVTTIFCFVDSKPFARSATLKQITLITARWYDIVEIHPSHPIGHTPVINLSVYHPKAPFVHGH